MILNHLPSATSLLMGSLFLQYGLMSFARKWVVAIICLLTISTTLLRAAETNAFPRWQEYKTIMWIGDSAYKKPEKFPLFLQRLREMGIDTGMIHNDGNPDLLVQGKFPYYLENIVNRGLCLKFNSKVTDWDKFVTDWAKNGRSTSALVRDYCLDDPTWMADAKKQMQRLVKKHLPNQPLAYDIRDELSITISANPFDYDFNPITLSSFRNWLKGEYSTLEKLNAEWQTEFASWDEIIPFTTDQIKQRMATGIPTPKGRVDWSDVAAIKFQPAHATNNITRWNFSPWADFRTYMDSSLARTLGDLRQAAREMDPETPVGIEGTQMPSAWGGYDLWKLSQSLDWMEPYDIGSAREIVGSFMPGKPLLTTVFEKDTQHAQRRLWHLLLEGDRGCLIWWSEDCIDWQSADYALTPKALALAPVLKEMTSPLAALFLKAKREFDPIAIVYSHPSIQADWLLESTVDGSTWLRRFSSFESEHNHLAKLRNGWLKGLQDLGFSPRFIPAQQLVNPVDDSIRALVFPGSLALSDQEVASVNRFTKMPGHLVFADDSFALFDQHGKFRLPPFRPLPSQVKESFLLPSPTTKPYEYDVATYASQRLSNGSSPFTAWLRPSLAGFRPVVSVPVETHTRVRRFHLKDYTLLAFERNIDYQMSEDLKQAGGNESLEKPVTFNATLQSPGHLYDLHTGRYLGKSNQLQVELDPWKPSLFAVMPEKVEGNILEFLSRKSQ